MLNQEATSPKVIFEGKKTLYLTKDPFLNERQFLGDTPKQIYSEERLDRVSTDTYPTKACFRFDEDYMGSKALTGLSLGDGRWVPENALRNGGFSVLVAGKSFGCGSSREHFAWSLKAAGIKLIVADSMERICAQNCQNIGLPYIEGNTAATMEKLLQGGTISLADTAEGMDRISREIVLHGGLFPFLKHFNGKVDLFKPETEPRPMTAVEKIIANHMGVAFVKPGDIGFIKADRRYSYEIFYPFSEAILKREVSGAAIQEPQSVYLFYDHSVLDPSKDAAALATKMRLLAKKRGLTLYDGDKKHGTEGICHTIMLDKYVQPGEVVLGTDSHTPHLGAAGAFAFGIGSTEWAGSLLTNQVRISIPPSIRVELTGRLPQAVMAKDVMLYLLSQKKVREGGVIGKILEYCGNTLDHLPFDEQAVLANMSAESGTLTGYITPNSNSIDHFVKRYQLTEARLNQQLYFSDPQAEYADEFIIDVSGLEPYIALPGDPRNGIPLSTLAENSGLDPHINTAFIGSCTGAKLFDIAAAASILEGRKIHSDVKLYVQPSSRDILFQAQNLGYIQIIREAGGIILPSACGACVNFGPGSIEKGSRGISSTNRNFPGRMGKGDVYLASPIIVAASALLGEIPSPQNLARLLPPKSSSLS